MNILLGALKGVIDRSFSRNKAMMAQSRCLGLHNRGVPTPSSPFLCLSSSTSSFSGPPLRYAVLGAGCAGLSVAFHLLSESPKELNLCIDIYDEIGIGGGASGVSGGLIHPYSPKVKLLWGGSECWNECLRLLSIAEVAATSSDDFDFGVSDFHGLIVQKRGILRPAVSMKNLLLLSDVILPELNNARNCLSSCRIETIDKEAAQNLVPNLCVPFNTAFYMPEAVNIHPQRYLQALYLACENLVKELSTSGIAEKELHMHKKSVHKLLDLEGEYQAVIICLGAKADMLPELAGKIPLRTCRGVVAHLKLPNNIGEEYPELGPSILSDAWLAIQGSRSLYLGSTWEWKSKNSSPTVSTSEASKALEELLPKAYAIYPDLKNWTFAGARAGLRAMPPLTPHGSLPLLGCVNDIVGENNGCKYWLFGGLGARGLLYHGWLGKLMARAVLACNEQLIPSELTSWKKRNP